MAALALAKPLSLCGRNATRSLRPRKQRAVSPRKMAPPRAMLGVAEMMQIAEAAPGSVDAPTWVIAVG